ncbi:hypothetical protein C1I97_18100, partial [Streptomyces sp. NTH33]
MPAVVGITLPRSTFPPGRGTICSGFPSTRARAGRVSGPVRWGGSRRAQGVLRGRPVRDLLARLRAVGRLPGAGAQPLDALR